MSEWFVDCLPSGLGGKVRKHELSSIGAAGSRSGTLLRTTSGEFVNV